MGARGVRRFLIISAGENVPLSLQRSPTSRTRSEATLELSLETRTDISISS